MGIVPITVMTFIDDEFVVNMIFIVPTLGVMGVGDILMDFYYFIGHGEG
jgi:hypothetical protein